jgi:hypothetical protein
MPSLPHENPARNRNGTTALMINCAILMTQPGLRDSNQVNRVGHTPVNNLMHLKPETPLTVELKNPTRHHTKR